MGCVQGDTFLKEMYSLTPYKRFSMALQESPAHTEPRQHGEKENSHQNKYILSQAVIFSLDARQQKSAPKKRRKQSKAFKAELISLWYCQVHYPWIHTRFVCERPTADVTADVAAASSREQSVNAHIYLQSGLDVTVHRWASLSKAARVSGEDISLQCVSKRTARERCSHGEEGGGRHPR